MTVAKTWPYGTIRRAVAIHARLVHPKKAKPDGSNDGQLIRDDLGEGHICVGAACADFSASNGDVGTITFTKGGPTGGYWRFVKDAQQPK